jgi:hypothetical protein
MRTNWKVGVGLLVLGVMVALVLAYWPGRPAVGAEDKGAGGGRYTVVMSDGTHVVVTDNKENKLYFYAVDKDGKPGDELKIRGTIDLNDVGKASLKPTKPK